MGISADTDVIRVRPRRQPKPKKATPDPDPSPRDRFFVQFRHHSDGTVDAYCGGVRGHGTSEDDALAALAILFLELRKSRPA